MWQSPFVSLFQLFILLGTFSSWECTAASVPVGEDLLTGGFSKNVDIEKLYPPNPPITDQIFMSLEFTHPHSFLRTKQDIVIDLYGSVVPKTITNFFSLCSGVRAVNGQDESQGVFTLSYKDSILHKIVPNSYIRGGVIDPRFGPFSIFGKSWEDENFNLTHDRPGRVTMANKGTPDSNDSEFMIITNPNGAPEFDGKHVVFGQVSSGLRELMDMLQSVERDTEGRPITDVVITSCVVDRRNLGNLKELHDLYEERVEKFNAGDLSYGVTMAKAMEPFGQLLRPPPTDDIIIYDSETEQFGWTRRFVMIFAVALICFLIYRYKLPEENSHIVSMRA